MWEHIRSRHRYTELDPIPREPDGSIRARSATTGRWVKVERTKLRQVDTPEEVAEAEAFVRREHLAHLAWQLSRELPYNLGVAVTNIALSGHGGSLTTAHGALRDEIERNHLASAQPPEEIHD